MSRTTATQYILALDQGTTGTTAAIVNKQGQIVAHSNREFTQHFPKPSWVEHDLDEIWCTVEYVVKTVLGEKNLSPKEIAGIGITNQRETISFWDRHTGMSCGPAIVWQDRRTAQRCRQLKDAGHQDHIHKQTGLYLDPYFSATKIEWLLHNNSNIQAGIRSNTLCCGTMESYLVFRLSGGAHHVTDLSNASRTMLLNINSGSWDTDLLNLFDIPEQILPTTVANTGEIAVTQGLSFLPDGIPISGMAGDQQAALFGQGCINPGDAKCTYGTGAFTLVNAGEGPTIPENGLLGTIAWQLTENSPIVYAIEGSTFIAGAVVQWLRDGLNIIDDAAQIEALARKIETSEGVYVIPALTGLAAPYWDPNATGAIFGITRGTTRAHIARATLEGIALRVTELLSCIQKELDTPLSMLRVDGGAAKNDLLMQYQADYAGLAIRRPHQLESTVLGAAFLAGIGLGWWSADSLPLAITSASDKNQASYFKPELSGNDREEILTGWRNKVQRILSHPSESEN